MTGRGHADRGYRAALARTHVEAFGFHSEQAAPDLLAMVGEAAAPGELVVELGCGAGILTEAFTAAGYQVLGVDQSAVLLQAARRRAPAAEYRHALFLDLELPRCAAVIAVGEVLGYAIDPRVDESALPTMFARVAAALRPGGMFAFDLAAPGRATPPRRLWWEGAEWLLTFDAREEGDRLIRRMSTFERDGDRWRRDDETHVLVLFEPEDVLAALRAAGLDAERLEGWGRGRSLPEHLHAYVARRPGADA